MSFNALCRLVVESTVPTHASEYSEEDLKDFRDNLKNGDRIRSRSGDDFLRSIFTFREWKTGPMTYHKDHPKAEAYVVGTKGPTRLHRDRIYPPADWIVTQMSSDVKDTFKDLLS